MGDTPAGFVLETPDFDNGGDIPPVHTCDGDNVSPSLYWTGAPVERKSYVLIVHDPDAPRGDFTHWLLYDIDADQLSLPGGPGADAFGRPGCNDFGRLGYGGPCPPPGHGKHRYVFDLYALDAESLPLPDGASRGEVEKALRGHTVAHTSLMGRYGRT